MAGTSKQHSKLYQDWPGEKIHNFGIFQGCCRTSLYRIMELLVFCTNSRILTLDTGATLDKPASMVQRERRCSPGQIGPKLVLVVVEERLGLTREPIAGYHPGMMMRLETAEALNPRILGNEIRRSRRSRLKQIRTKLLRLLLRAVPRRDARWCRDGEYPGPGATLDRLS